MSWLITGGAGYIGAHVIRHMRAAGHEVVVVDDLSTGDAGRVPDDVPLVVADVRDRQRVAAALRDYGATGVMHLAARKDVAESVADPLRYYDENLAGLRELLAAACAARVSEVVYSSSAAVYGTTPHNVAANESTPTRPQSSYGRSKLIGEWMLADAARAYGIRSVSLRYFNVAGAGALDLGDRTEHTLLSMLLRAVHDGRRAQVFGGDYPTRDGSCVRDYVHVDDIASAHLRAVEALRDTGVTHEVFNVGGGTGTTVLEMIAAVGKAAGRPLAFDVVGRRPGDPPSVVASASRIAAQLGWRCRNGIDDIVASAWEAFRHRHLADAA